MHHTPDKAFECPICLSYPSLIFRCTECEEVRCSSPQCTGSEGSGYARWAADATRCRHCHSGSYRRLGFHSIEMAAFRNAYRAKLDRPRPLEEFFTEEKPDHLDAFFISAA